MTTVSFSPARGFPDSAFATLLDLARLRAGAGRGEVCEVCSTINMGSAWQCKCCAHKLSAFYAAANTPAPATRRARFAGRCHEIQSFLLSHFASAPEALQ
jgi:hypothetical protein